MDCTKFVTGRRGNSMRGGPLGAGGTEREPDGLRADAGGVGGAGAGVGAGDPGALADGPPAARHDPPRPAPLAGDGAAGGVRTAGWVLIPPYPLLTRRVEIASGEEHDAAAVQ